VARKRKQAVGATRKRKPVAKRSLDKRKQAEAPPMPQVRHQPARRTVVVDDESASATDESDGDSDESDTVDELPLMRPPLPRAASVAAAAVKRAAPPPALDDSDDSSDESEDVFVPTRRAKRPATRADEAAADDDDVHSEQRGNGRGAGAGKQRGRTASGRQLASGARSVRMMGAQGSRLHRQPTSS
jgi:hypothetical protein